MLYEKKSLGFHPFAKKVIDGVSARLDLIQTLKDSMKEGKRRSVKRKKLWQWEHERYEYEVLIHLAAIMAAMERLEQSQSFIRTFPQPRSYEKKGITQYAWIEYHYTSYVITLVSLFDIALILTNTVFRLGNVERKCTADRIMKDPSVKQSPVKRALANLKRQITLHKNDRHLYVHRGQMPNIPFAIGSDENAYMKLVSLFQQMEFTSTLDREMLDLAYTSRAKELCARIQEERSIIYKHLWQLFDHLLPIYDGKFIALIENCRNMLKKELERRRLTRTQPRADD